MGLKIIIWRLDVEVLRNLSGKNENWTEKFHPESMENQQCSKLFNRKSTLLSGETRLLQEKLALKQSCSALILLLWKIDFSAPIRDFQVMYSAQSELKQRWSTLTISESEVITAEIFWELSPGLLWHFQNWHFEPGATYSRKMLFNYSPYQFHAAPNSAHQ